MTKLALAACSGIALLLAASSAPAQTGTSNPGGSAYLQTPNAPTGPVRVPDPNASVGCDVPSTPGAETGSSHYQTTKPGAPCGVTSSGPATQTGSTHYQGTGAGPGTPPTVSIPPAVPPLH